MNEDIKDNYGVRFHIARIGSTHRIRVTARATMFGNKRVRQIGNILYHETTEKYVFKPADGVFLTFVYDASDLEAISKRLEYMNKERLSDQHQHPEVD